MNSRWYEEQVKEGYEARLENQRKSPKAMIGMGIFIIIIFIILFVVHVKDPNYAFGTSCAFVGGMAVFLFGIVTIGQSIANKKTADFSLPDLENQLNKILTTQEKADEFDMEMYSDPEKILIDKTNEKLFITPHYVVNKSGLMGAPVYTVVCRDEIKSIRYVSSRDHSKISPLARLYDIDLLDANEKKIGGLTLEGRDKLNEFKHILNMED